ncbi:transposase [Streptomyces echinoruber]|uniref:transposase n=1 Tax=Streptomyces echinoruber TaxID=68898 RepID=UPI0035711079
MRRRRVRRRDRVHHTRGQLRGPCRAALPPAVLRRTGTGPPNGRWGRIVPDGPRGVTRPPLPSAWVRLQGGGGADIDEEAAFAAIVHVLAGGCAWRALPPCSGASKPTVHRRFPIRSRIGVWGRPGTGRRIEMPRAVLDTAHVRAERGRNRRPGSRAPWHWLCWCRAATST